MTPFLSMVKETILDSNTEIPESRAALKKLVARLIYNFDIQKVLSENEKLYTNEILRPWYIKKTGNRDSGNRAHISREVVSLVAVSFSISRTEDEESRETYIEDLEKLCYSGSKFRNFIAKLETTSIDYIEKAGLNMSNFHQELEDIIYELLEVPDNEKLSSTEAAMLYDDYYDFLDESPRLAGCAKLLLEEMYRIRNRLLIDANTDLKDDEIDRVDQETLEIVNFVRQRLEELGIK